ncbi:acyl-CoA synthetase [Alicyclobacillaceae bacterium I2511]|nr:acyl-CoA synthetase [Alicyclobacillaceae bacterium I2511]
MQIARARRNTLGDILTRSAARYPDKLALVYGQERLTYREFDNRVQQTAQVLRQDGVKRGTPVAVLSKNSMDFVLLVFATARLGAVLVPVNYMLTPDEIAYVLTDAAVVGVACAPDFVNTLEEALKRAGRGVEMRYEMDQLGAAHPGWQTLATRREGTFVGDGSNGDPLDADVTDDDVAQILYTSGTESQPKGVMLTHRSLVAEYVSTVVDGSMTAEDVSIYALPLYHSAQLNCFLGPSVYLGGTGIILSQASPELILRTVAEVRATLLFCPPTVWIGLLRHPNFHQYDLTSLQKCYYGAAIMPVEVLKELSQRLPQARFWNFYGQTEVAPLATILKPEDQLRKLGSAGKPGLNVETRIVDAEDHFVPPGTVGEIVHRTPHAMLGYLNQPDKTAAAFRGGWLHSGDLGVMDEEGYLTVVDRKKDMIKTGGINVASREVEEFLYQARRKALHFSAGELRRSPLGECFVLFKSVAD